MFTARSLERSYAGICKIWHYKRKIAKLREKAGLPELYDPDDLPDPVYDPNYVQVLTEKQQIDLHYRLYHLQGPRCCCLSYPFSCMQNNISS